MTNTTTVTTISTYNVTDSDFGKAEGKKDCIFSLNMTTIETKIRLTVEFYLL